MSRGMAIPVRTNRRGRAELIEGSAYLKQVISIGLTAATSRNPFERGNGVDIGLDEAVVFGTNDAVAEALARGGIVRFFSRLRSAGLARLVPGEGIRFSRTPGEGDLLVEVNYFDLEADDEETVIANLSQGLRAAPAGGINT